MQRLVKKSRLGLSANKEKCSRIFWPKDDIALRIKNVEYKEFRGLKVPDLNLLSKSEMEVIDFTNWRNQECDSRNMVPTIIIQRDIESRLAQNKQQCFSTKKQIIDKGTSFAVEEDVYFYDTKSLDEDTKFGEFESNTDMMDSVTGSSSKDNGFLPQIFHFLSETEGVFPQQSSNNAISVQVQDEDSKPFNKLSVNDRGEERNMPVSSIRNKATSCCIGDILKHKSCLMDSNARAHYKVTQRRLKCGSRLEKQRKEMKRRENHSQLRNSTTEKYNSYLEEYLNLCHQESVILNEIATIQADIDEWQKTNRHKQAVVMKSVLLEPVSSQYSSLKVNKSLNEKYQRKQGLLFPPLPPPKPLMLSMCKSISNKSMSKRGVKTSMRQLSNRVKLAAFENMPPTCTFYSFYPLLKPLREHQRPTPAIRSDSEEKIKHRLQKYQGLLEPEYHIRPQRETALYQDT
ncbi:hypothetical protein ACJMK2_009880 [Sinanodonta woodiana]|uniref:Uncharacterized protein n=1 Tax=Sinanodonta woodiana TaxID=1069815 RepID=A0ABD3VGL3_SINWO